MDVEKLLASEKKELRDAFNVVKKKLEGCHKPLFIHDGDGDGVMSLMLMQKLLGKYRAFLCPHNVDNRFIDLINSQDYDMIIILDVPRFTEEQFDSFKGEVVWIDHHYPIKFSKHNLTYFNPMNFTDGDNRCTTYWAFLFSGAQYLWQGASGIISDWQFPFFADEFRDEYPDFLPADVTSTPESLYLSDIGLVARMVNFNLKGNSLSIKKSIEALSHIEHPSEIINGSSSYGAIIKKKYEKVFSEYKDLQERLVDADKKDDYSFIITYKERNYSFSSDLSNEAVFRYPNKKLYIIAREGHDFYRCSTRSPVGSKVNLPSIFETVFSKVNGNGGGHFHASGCSVASEDFDEFVRLMIEEAKKMDP